MNPLQFTVGVGGCVALVTMLAAFVLTLWPSRARTAVAAILYSIGILIYSGILAR